VPHLGQLSWITLVSVSSTDRRAPPSELDTRFLPRPGGPLLLSLGRPLLALAVEGIEGVGGDQRDVSEESDNLKV
jgi:hypothetical protein